MFWYLITTGVLNLLLAMVWKTSDWFNTALKLLLYVMAVWALVLVFPELSYRLTAGRP